MTDIVDKLTERAASYRLGGPSSEHTASLLENAAFAIKTLRSALLPFAAAAGMIPTTHGPKHEPICGDEPVNVSCAGFSVGDLTVSDFDAALRKSVEVFP